MPLFTPRAFDDRGREVTYLDPMSTGSQIDRATRERVNRRTDLRPGMSIMFIALLMAPPIYRLVSSTVPAALAQVAFVLAFATAAWFLVLLPVRQFKWSRDWKLRYKLAHHCPACQYNMQSLPAEPDGCTICPECGAAWKIPAGP